MLVHGRMCEILAELSGRDDFDRLNWFVEPDLYEVAYRRSVIWARRAQQAPGTA